MFGVFFSPQSVLVLKFKGLVLHFKLFAFSESGSSPPSLFVVVVKAFCVVSFIRKKPGRGGRA